VSSLAFPAIDLDWHRPPRRNFNSQKTTARSIALQCTAKTRNMHPPNHVVCGSNAENLCITQPDSAISHSDAMPQLPQSTAVKDRQI
jgi:hypothetical protein